jgi:hypothetical protein
MIRASQDVRSTHHCVTLQREKGCGTATRPGDRDRNGAEQGLPVRAEGMKRRSSTSTGPTGTSCRRGWYDPVLLLVQEGKRPQWSLSLLSQLTPGLPLYCAISMAECCCAFQEDAFRQVQPVNNLQPHFLADVSHELRTPLTIMVSLLALIKIASIAPKNNLWLLKYSA